MEEEEWRPIQDYPGYLVSNLGRVGSTRIYHGSKEMRILAPAPSRGGYLGVCLSNDDGKKSHKIHRLVAIAFIPNPDGKTDVDHINSEERTNNHVSNLRWATRTENLMNTRVSTKNTSGFRGVSFYTKEGKYKARIYSKGTLFDLGFFDTPEEASAVYNAKAKEIHGEFYRPLGV